MPREASLSLRLNGRQRPAPALAIPATRLIGREAEVAAVRALLLEAGGGLVTLTGSPGVGKSRLSLQVADDLRPVFADGVFCVPLGPVGDPILVVPTIARAIGVIEPVAGALADTMVEFLRCRRVLLLLDDVERQPDAVTALAELLSGCTGVRMLATSREPLHVRGERRFPVPPLAGAAAVELYVERARAADPCFTLSDANANAVAATCAGLGGLPLSIELVAARVGDRSGLAPANGQTLRGTLDWSYRLLEPGEQALFARLGVFAGGGSLAAAEEVANADDDLPMTVLEGLTALAGKNLVRLETRTGGRCQFAISGPIREYARERLVERDEDRETGLQFAAYYLTLTQEAHRHLTGPDQPEWLERLDREHHNLRAALAWYIAQRAVEPALSLIAALWRFWHIRSHQTEALRWIRLVLAMDGPGHVRVRAQAMYGAGWIALDHNDHAAANAFFHRSLALFRSLGSTAGVAEALHGVGAMAQAEGDEAEADRLLNESLTLYRQLHDDEGIAWSLDHLGMGALGQGDLAPPTGCSPRARRGSASSATPGAARSCSTTRGWPPRPRATSPPPGSPSPGRWPASPSWPTAGAWPPRSSTSATWHSPHRTGPGPGPGSPKRWS